ncbi:MAG: tRNA pseudouridine(55) synthase TruB [Fusobacteriota bacterium]
MESKKIGIININKPKGITSYDVIRNLKKLLNMKRIGHTGTLDPLATGVLVICIGRATKLVSEIVGKEKVYRATMELGYSTDTYDTEGKIENKVDSFEVSKEKVEKILKSYLGEQTQIPPMYSAVKVNGKKLYEYARENKKVERKARKIKIDKIDLIDYDGKKVVFETVVSKGTYIRTLINDIGKDLKTYATMTDLVRTRVGGYKLEDTFTLKELEEMKEKNDFSFIKSIEESFSNLKRLNLETQRDKKLFKNGNTVVIKKEDGKYRIYEKDVFLGLGQVVENRLKGYKYFIVS